MLNAYQLRLTYKNKFRLKVASFFLDILGFPFLFKFYTHLHGLTVQFDWLNKVVRFK